MQCRRYIHGRNHFLLRRENTREMESQHHCSQQPPRPTQAYMYKRLSVQYTAAVLSDRMVRI